MRRLFILIVLIVAGNQTIGQPAAGQCYFSKKGFKAGSRLILIPLEGNRYVVEFYQYGMGVFWGLPYKDTLVYENGVCLSDQNKINIKGNKLKVMTKEGKRTFKYSVREACDPEINWTRNWSYREADRYKIKDEETSRQFWNETDPLLRTHCHNNFMALMAEIKNELGVSD